MAVVAFVLLCLPAGRLNAQAKPYQFSDPKAINTISFIADSALQPIMGLAVGITGRVVFDPSNPTAVSGEWSVPSGMIGVPNVQMQEVLRSADWLDTPTFPAISFRITQAEAVTRTEDGQFAMVLNGVFTLKGIEKPMKIPVTFAHLPGRVPDRGGGREGDLLMVRSTFSIARSDFGIKPSMSRDRVAEDIKITVAIAGYPDK
jgi:polyisoprenoid-binding protein YceI